MSVFADSSALVKLYADEADHELVRAISLFVVSQIARVEVPAALWRKQRLGELSPEAAHELTEEFEADLFGTKAEGPRLIQTLLTPEVLDGGARLCAVHGLRAYDAVQLGSALAVRRADPACDTMAGYDATLRRAAAAEGLALLP